MKTNKEEGNLKNVQRRVSPLAQKSWTQAANGQNVEEKDVPKTQEKEIVQRQKPATQPPLVPSPRSKAPVSLTNGGKSEDAVLYREPV